MKLRCKKQIGSSIRSKKPQKDTCSRRRKRRKPKKTAVDATFYRQKQVVNGELYSKKKEAEGLIALVEAEGVYIRTLLSAFGGNYTAFRDFMMINKGMYQEIARINGEALQGLKPNISIWTGANGEGGGIYGAAMKEVSGVYKMLLPLFKTVHEQTGMLPPAWMGMLTETNKVPSGY